MRAVSKDYKALKEDSQQEFARNHEIISRFYITNIIEGLNCEDIDFKLSINSVKDALITCL